MRECYCITIRYGLANRRACEQAIRDSGYTGIITSEWSRTENPDQVTVRTRARMEDSKAERILAVLGDTVIRARNDRGTD